MRACVALLLALLLAGCSAEAPRPEKKAATVVPPVDESRWLPSKNLVSTHVVAEKLLDPSIAPGGTVGEYRDAEDTYQLGLIRMPSSDKAAFLLLDVKKVMNASKYLPNMGGYFGTQGEIALYVFAKGPYVAVVKGLGMEKADPIARTFAALIPRE